MSTHKSHFFEKIFIDFFIVKCYYINQIKKGGGAMLEYKINIIEELAKVGINTTEAKKSGIFGQETMRKFRAGDTSISLDNLNRLCCVLEMQPRDIIKYVETENDRQKYLSKICDKKC